MKSDAGRTTIALLHAAFVACAVLALANLPATELPVGWLLAFTIPAAILGRLRWPRRGWQRALAAAALQTIACWLALALSAPPSRPAALACTILPPLAFATARQQEVDGVLGLFLSFCVLLVGVILDGVDPALTIAYAAAACLALRCSTHLAAHAVARPMAPRARSGHSAMLAMSAAALLVPCLATAFVVERALGALPSPSRGAGGAVGPSDAADTRRVGLDDSFVLDGGGPLSGLQGEHLVRVHTSSGAPVPADLYLRSGFFAVPGLDRWQTGALDQVRVPGDGLCALRPPRPGARTHALELERFAGARNFVFVPPGTVGIRGLTDLLVDRGREWVRQSAGSQLDIYEVEHERPDLPSHGPAFDPRARRLGLLSLPAEVDRERCEALLARWGVGDEPLAAITAIAAGLASHCRYDRIEPTGPFAHALDNFLFASGDRRGYCMHFASAAALLLRLRGIPCRIGVGLYGGAPDARDGTARIYGSQHAHAWVEIPFADVGYVVFDPTPAVERGARMPSRPDPAAAGAEGDRQRGPGLLAGLLAFCQSPWVLAAAVAFAIAAWSWRRQHRQRHAPTAAAPVRSARRLLARTLQALADAGHRRSRGETLERFAHTLARQQRLRPEVAAAFAAYQEVRFGGRPFDGGRERALADGVRAATAMPPLPP